jgi:hypothetical protein
LFSRARTNHIGVLRSRPPFEAAARLRLLECWLPLAQELNQRCGWGRDAAALEALILAAGPRLALAGSAPEAYGILWHYHLLHATRRL